MINYDQWSVNGKFRLIMINNDKFRLMMIVYDKWSINDKCKLMMIND